MVEWDRAAVVRPHWHGRQRALVRRLADRRVGPSIVESLGPVLDELSDPDRIAAIAAGVLECETAEEFLAWAEEA